MKIRNRLAGAILAAAALTLVLAAGTSSASASHFGVKTFQSPSKNIGCVMLRAPKNQGGGEARCDIGERDWTAPQKPHSCHLDYGQGLAVGEHGKGDFVCAGDTVLHQGPVLDYGDSIKFGGFKCVSNETNMRCHNLKNHHGFALSRQYAKRF